MVTAETGLRSSTAVPLAAAAGFFFCARFALTLVFIAGFGAEEQLGSITSVVLSLVLFAAVALDRTCRSEPSVTYETVNTRWIFLYLAFAAASLTWSASASRPASAAYLCATCMDVATTVLLLRADTQRIASAMMKGFVVAGCLIAIAAWIMPAEYDLRLGNQDYFNANTIANLSAFGFFFAQYLARSTEHRWRAVSAVFALTVMRSLSKATMAAFLVSVSVLYIADRSMRRRTKFFLAGASIAAVLCLWGLFEAYYDLYTTTGNQAQTLTGRTSIWIYTVDAIPERLLFGHGLDSMWKVVPAFGTFQARHAENELLQQLYSFGAIGLTLAAAVYTDLFRNIRGISNSRVRLPIMCLFVYVLIRGCAEAETFDLLFPLWAVVLFKFVVEAQPHPAEEPARVAAVPL